MRADPSVSRTLKPDLRSVLEAGGTAFRVVRKVTSTYFWAGIYHFGRGPVTAKKGKWLAFWRLVPKALDPRLTGGKFPRKKVDIRRLQGRMSTEEFRAAIESGRLTLAKRVGPYRGNRFMPRAFRKQARDPFLQKQVDETTEQEITKYLDLFMGTSEKKPIRHKKIFLRIRRPE